MLYLNYKIELLFLKGVIYGPTLLLCNISMDINLPFSLLLEESQLNLRQNIADYDKTPLRQ
jgi:hypothetical protein